MKKLTCVLLLTLTGWLHAGPEIDGRPFQREISPFSAESKTVLKSGDDREILELLRNPDPYARVEIMMRIRFMSASTRIHVLDLALGDDTIWSMPKSLSMQTQGVFALFWSEAHQTIATLLFNVPTFDLEKPADRSMLRQRLAELKAWAAAAPEEAQEAPGTPPPKSKNSDTSNSYAAPTATKAPAVPTPSKARSDAATTSSPILRVAGLLLLITAAAGCLVWLANRRRSSG